MVHIFHLIHGIVFYVGRSRAADMRNEYTGANPEYVHLCANPLQFDFSRNDNMLSREVSTYASTICLMLQARPDMIGEFLSYEELSSIAGDIFCY